MEKKNVNNLIVEKIAMRYYKSKTLKLTAVPVNIQPCKSSVH